MKKVIFMRANNSPYVKVVKSDDPEKTLRIFKSYQPHGGYMVGIVENTDAVSIESKWFRKNKDRSLTKGFFLVPDSVVLRFVAMNSETLAKLYLEVEREMKEKSLTVNEVLSSVKKYESHLKGDFIGQVEIFVKTLTGRVMSNGEILKEINEAGLNIGKRTLGTCLIELGYKSRMISVDGLNKRAYHFV